MDGLLPVDAPARTYPTGRDRSTGQGRRVLLNQAVDNAGVRYQDI